MFIENLPEYVFGSQNNYQATGEYQTKGIVMSTFELGFTFEMGMKHSVSTAMFLDMGYGTVIDQKQGESFIGYNPTGITERKANGLYSTAKNASIKPIAFGLTLGLNFL